MSGPKVVRVITREELIAAGESLLRRLDAALGEWQKACAAVGVSPADQKAFQDRRDALEQMLRADRFGEFGRAAIAEIDFLDSDAGRRREKAAQAWAQERARLQSGKELASVLLRQTQVDAAERADLQRAAAGELALKDLDAVLARARQSLFRIAPTQLGANQQTLAARLAGGEKAEDFEGWRQKLAAESPRLEALLGHVSELELLGEARRAAEFHQELLAAAALPEDAGRGMRLDSLVISLRRAKEEAVALAQLRRQAALFLAELQVFQEAGEVMQALKAAIRGTSSEVQAALAAAEKRLGELHAAQAASARRRAVLDGLQQLGYQVHEELSTATSASGRLVVRNSASTGYGVEIAAGVGMERLQVRTVAFDPNRDVAGDIPAEQRWCDDFGTLKEMLQAQGSEVVVEEALGVGAVPLKLLAGSSPESQRRATAAPNQVARK
jgi:hypothetical protein